ncbi:YlzJ-like family protein [Falsibacillus pallidus]|uniref:YlzJ-like protein n=1 Tax=Falsibacillus pallidus TaxID=493781 RepID=A0A370GUN3_9BACI|nr:YlzJ-like family protein [Falsibacillus pallidus]RDI47397.1 YlzJ-like protein [Falsibacillus pallidus]
MILYTSMPQELIFPPGENTFDSTKMITWNGIPLMVQKCDQGYRVMRIMSSDPSHYLTPECEPGQYINNQ